MSHALRELDLAVASSPTLKRCGMVVGNDGVFEAVNYQNRRLYMVDERFIGETLSHKHGAQPTILILDELADRKERADEDQSSDLEMS